MRPTVVDASVLTAFYVSDTADRQAVTATLSNGDELHAPAHLDAEVTSALRRLARHNQAVEDLAPAALKHLAGFPIRRVPLAPLLERMWQLRENVTSYDAAYIALAERLGAPVITYDVKLANAVGPRCTFKVIR